MEDYTTCESRLDATNRIDFSLKDISKWSKEDSPVRIPALQRGLVWVPSQIELLWDSLMRGIPIGSFVICSKIKSQNINVNENYGFHLLDGQQRANAIQLGFDNPFKRSNPSEVHSHNETKAILWIDLCPSFLSNSTREFLFRVTTIAHPWGYNKTDNDGILPTYRIRNAIQDEQGIRDESIFDSMNYKRPAPDELYPVDADSPIPMGILWDIYDNWDKNNEITLCSLSDHIKQHLKSYFFINGKWDKKWAKITYDKVDKSKDLVSIWTGLSTANKTTILALMVPNNLLQPTKQEINLGKEIKEDITAIEHLFQRLNRQGTELKGEELIYSMIKAYWPEVRNSIEQIEAKNKLMPASRLVSLAIRTIMTEYKNDTQEDRINSKNTIAAPLFVTDIRKLAVDKSKAELREEIINYINHELEGDCKTIDRLLGLAQESVSREWGLPPVLRSSIAYNLPDSYLLLMLLVRKHRDDINDDISKALTGIITWLKWFGGNVNKVSEALYFSNDLSVSTIIETISKSINNGTLFQIFFPCELESFLKLPSKTETAFLADKEFDDIVSCWSFDSLYQNQDDQDLNRRWGHFLERLMSEREILLYAQRNYIIRRFKDYDPSRKDFWKGYNRPWDYDHIFAKKYAYNQKSNNRFLPFCQKWRDSNGNMRAWPFEANRSDQAMRAKEKMKDDKQIIDSFILDGELDGFNVGEKAIFDSGKALLFANSCRSRLIRIYREWFYSLSINRLLPGHTHNMF